MSFTKKYTIETRLDYNKNLYDYLDKLANLFHTLYRYVWKNINGRKDYNQLKSVMIDMVKSNYGVSYALASSVVSEAYTRFNNLKYLMNEKIEFINFRTSSILSSIRNLEEKINKIKEEMKIKKISNNRMQYYKGLKQKHYKKNVEVNYLFQELTKLKQDLEKNKLTIAHGGKEIFHMQHSQKYIDNHDEWYKLYTDKRDSRIIYNSSYKKKSGNLGIALKYLSTKDKFAMYINVEDILNINNTSKYIYVTNLDFKYMKEELIKILKEQEKQIIHPLYIKFIRRKNSWYLQVTIDYEIDDYITSSTDGTIGLDYNVGFIELAEIDAKGNLCNSVHYELQSYRMGNQNENELKETVAKIVEYAKIKKKDLVIENLNFNVLKAKLIDNKFHRKIINAFDYSKYIKFFENAAFRNKVRLIIVDPKYSSINGNRLYSYPKKLSIHQAASYVIARRGKGLKD